MPFSPIPKSTSADALAEMREVLDGREEDIATVEDRLHAQAFAMQCQRDWEEESRLERAEHITTEVLEVVVTTGAGALSTWKSGMVPLGAIANYVAGLGFKAGSIWNPKNRTARIACRTGKVLLHSQLALSTHNLIRGGS